MVVFQVFVFPIFEIYPGNEMPRTKQELVGLYKKGAVISFHKHLCSKCHRIPGMNEWLNDSAPGN